MMLNLGTNNLYSTPIYLDNFVVKQEYVDSAMLKEIHSDLNELVLGFFDKYIQSILPNEDINSWKYKMESWINTFHLNEMEYHTHNGASLSAVVYVLNEAEGGEITFYDPRSFAARGYDMKFRPLFDPISYKPKAGDIVIFPSFLYHSVKPTKGLRISIPFDLFLFDDD